MKKISILAGTTLLLLGVCFVFLFMTESGLRVIEKGVNRFSGGVVSIGRVEGRLLGAGTLTHIRLASSGAAFDIDRLDYSWRPENLFKAKLKVGKLIISEVNIALKDSPENPPASDAVGLPEIKLPEVLLPFSVLVERLFVDKLNIVGNDGKNLLVVDKAVARFEGNADRVTVHEFDLQGPDIGLNFHGNIEIQDNRTLDLLGNWRVAGFGFQPMAGTFLASGPLKGPHLEFGVHSPAAIRVAGDFVNLLEKPEWTAKFEAKDVDLSKLIEDCPKIELATVRGDLAGDFANYRGHVQAEGTWDTLEGMHLVSDITGDFLGIDFPSLRIDTRESSAQAEGGKISWKDIFSWEGRFLFKNFDPSVITKELQGRLTSELVSVGDVKEHGVVASFDVLTLKGVLRDHNVSAKGKVFLSETDVHTDGLTLRSGDVAGVAHIENGLFSWADEPHWSGKIRLDGFDPSWLYPEFPGSINGEFTGEGSLGDNGLEGSLNIKKISGTLRGNELSGGGEISLLDDTLQTSGINLQSGASKLAVNGQAGQGLALDFTLSSPDIGLILPNSKGSLFLQGSLKGKLGDPQLDAKMPGTGLRYRKNRVARVQAEIHSLLKSDGRLIGSLSGEKISLPGFFIDNGTIDLNGTLAKHQIVVDGTGPKGAFGFKAHGTYLNEWHGELSRLYAKSVDYGSWRQEGNATVTAGRDGVLLERFCLADEKSTVCLGGDVRLGKKLLWATHGEVHSVPLEWLNRLNLAAEPVRGRGDADFSAKGDDHRILSAKAKARVSSADVLVKAQNTERVTLYFDDSVLTLELTDKLLHGSVNVRMRNGSRLVLTADVEGAGNFADPIGSLPLKGNLQLKEFDLATLSAFTGYGVEPTGWVDNALTLAGTVGQPMIYGKINIRDGGIDLPYQGITLSNIVLSVEAGENAAQITGKATSGPGQLTAVGSLQYGTKGLEGKLNIQGENFLLVNLPEYALRVNSDVLLTFSNDKGEIQGTVDVPYGLVAPEAMTDSISASEDVILIHGTKEERLNGWPFDMNINVRLGDDVRVDGYGLKGRLVGNLRVNTTPDNSLSSRGELDLVEGTFTIYGRTLSIERGRMLFTGGPIDNPGIDVRAQVKVSDEEARGKGYTVGMDISGLVQDLQYHLFSDPYMEDSEILSLMIVGHSLADSTQTEGNLLEAATVTSGLKGSSKFVKGIGSFLQLDDLHLEGSSTKENVSLVVGKRVTKALYLGYDLNMFSQLGEFRVRYDLTRGFSVETRSSSESTGADLLYSFER